MMQYKPYKGQGARTKNSQPAAAKNESYRGSKFKDKGERKAAARPGGYNGKGKLRPVRLAVTILLILVLLGAVVFAVLLGIILWGDHDEINGEPQVMVILGCQVKPWGPSILLQDRLDKALEYLDGHPETVVVVSGGQGSDEHISEAQAMRDYLVEQGFPSEQILMEDRSSNTKENLQFSLALLEEQGYDAEDGVVIVSNGFHLSRVRMLWGWYTEGRGSLSTLAAPSSHLPSRLKMYIREPIGMVKSFFLDR